MGKREEKDINKKKFYTMLQSNADRRAMEILKKPAYSRGKQDDKKVNY